MIKRQLWWKFILTACALIWAVSELLPLNDRDFGAYILSEATQNVDELRVFVERVEESVKEKKVSSVYAGMKILTSTEHIDLARYFPKINLADVKNLQQRNEILLSYLLKKSQSPLKLGLDLKGGVAFTLKMDEKAFGEDNYLNESRLEKAVEIMHERVNGLGLTEPVIRVSGKDQIEVQLPGVSMQQNPDAIKALQKPAKLTFHRVYRLEIPRNGFESSSVPGYMIMKEERVNNKTGEIYEDYLYVKRVPDMGGESIDHAFVSLGEAGGYQINLNFTIKGGQAFKELTSKIATDNRDPEYSQLPEGHPGRYGRLAIVLDGQLYSAPRVMEAIAGGSASITGSFTQREAFELANVLNNPLEFALTVSEMYEVGPSLAEDARDASIRASILGVGLVALFMIGYYRLSGLVAMIAVTVNLLMTLGAMAMFGATLTLPGVAALVLTVGMAVDAHILIFERMREELRLGKSMRTALLAGHQKAFGTILDSNLTTLLASGILIFFGTGPVKGFGVSLSLGILATLFTALIISYMLLEWLVDRGWLRSMVQFSFFYNTKIRFLSYGRFSVILGFLVILAGIGGVVIRGQDILGVDFRGGEVMTLGFKNKIPVADLHVAMKNFGMAYAVPIYQSGLTEDKEKLKIETHIGDGQILFQKLMQTFPEAQFEFLGEQRMGASISRSLQWNALIAIGLALLGILIYVAFRFEVGYGVGAAVTTFMDAVMAVGIFVWMGGQFSASMVAAVLMIVGYSINDKIVVFDRIREELILNPTLNLLTVVESSINKTLSRTTLTSLTTFLAALALYVFAEGEICDFALLFMFGIVLGTISSIFIASPIFYWWHKGNRHHVEAREILPAYEWDASTKIGR